MRTFMLTLVVFTLLLSVPVFGCGNDIDVNLVELSWSALYSYREFHPIRWRVLYTMFASGALFIAFKLSELVTRQ